MSPFHAFPRRDVLNITSRLRWVFRASCRWCYDTTTSFLVWKVTESLKDHVHLLVVVHGSDIGAVFLVAGVSELKDHGSEFVGDFTNPATDWRIIARRFRTSGMVLGPPPVLIGPRCDALLAATGPAECTCLTRTLWFV